MLGVMRYWFYNTNTDICLVIIALLFYLPFDTSHSGATSFLKNPIISGRREPADDEKWIELGTCEIRLISIRI